MLSLKSLVKKDSTGISLAVLWGWGGRTLWYKLCRERAMSPKVTELQYTNSHEIHFVRPVPGVCSSGYCNTGDSCQEQSTILPVGANDFVFIRGDGIKGLRKDC